MAPEAEGAAAAAVVLAAVTATCEVLVPLQQRRAAPRELPRAA